MPQPITGHTRQANRYRTKPTSPADKKSVASSTHNSLKDERTKVLLVSEQDFPAVTGSGSCSGRRPRPWPR
jgi:hypothetical protein